MSTVTEPSISTLPAAEPLPPYPGPQMVPVDFAPPDPLPPPPRKENAALIRLGTGLAALGSGVLIVALFITPWFFVREISVVQPPPQSQGKGAKQTARRRLAVSRRVSSSAIFTISASSVGQARAG